MNAEWAALNEALARVVAITRETADEMQATGAEIARRADALNRKQAENAACLRMLVEA